MIVDATDAAGRRYQRVDPKADFTPAVRGLHEAHAQRCVDCSRVIGPTEVFYWRNNASDGSQRGVEGLLATLTADTVCTGCTEPQIATMLAPRPHDQKNTTAVALKNAIQTARAKR